MSEKLNTCIHKTRIYCYKKGQSNKKCYWNVGHKVINKFFKQAESQNEHC